MDIDLRDPINATDEALMAALQGGDDAALAALMERWESPVKSFLLRLGVPPSGVEDVAQDAFVRLYEQRARFRAGCAFKPWFLTIAGNLGRNALRWRGRHPGESLEAAEAGGVVLADGSAISPADAAEQSAEAARVRSAVAALPAPLREAVVCVELEDLSHAEAAAVLGCSSKAVETRLYRARRALRELLGDLLPGKQTRV
jgi:RNA polymerase sigma-70 factor (ECF subfamily)